MSAPDPALLGALVVAAIAAAVDIYLAGGARLAGQYEKERRKFYDDNWEKCRDLDELAGLDFTRALVTSDLWKLVNAGQASVAATANDGESAVRIVEVQVRARTGKIRQDLESLLTQFRSRTGNRERLEQSLQLFDRCADRTRKGWAGFALIVAVGALGFAGYASQSSDFTPGIAGILILLGIGGGGLVYLSGLDWLVANKELKRCRHVTETAIHEKIHFREPSVQGLQAPPAISPAPPANASGAMGAQNVAGTAVGPPARP